MIRCLAPDDLRTAAELKTERLHMLISPSELDKIDAWRFRNRIGTRAEAVRQLVAAGLEAKHRKGGAR